MDGLGHRRGFLTQALLADQNSWLIPRIRAAAEAGLPPLAVILRNPRHKEYTDWDLRLLVAYYTHDQLLRGSVPVYWDESDRVAFDVKTGISKSRRAISQREERDSKKGQAQHGVYYYAVPRAIDGGPLPTMEEWLAEREAKQGKDRGGPQAR